jgi:acyl-CoA reductase-like NAD-dependent aldehyde dehydrogenase
VAGLRTFDNPSATRRPGSASSYFESVDPYHGTPWARIQTSSVEDVGTAVAAAKQAFEGSWRAATPTGRGKLMFALAEILDEEADELALTESRDNGKVLREMLPQAQGLGGWYRYFGGFADKIGGRTVSADKGDFLTYVDKEPVGVVAAITAWNSPLLLLAYKLAPALAAGCTLIVKPSELASASTLQFASCFARAGFPPGVFSVVTGGPDIGHALISHPGVNKITFTGSTSVGRDIAKTGAARFIDVSLELGGKSANIVFGDAALSSAANGVIAGIFAAAGQTCMAGSRLLVHESIAEELVSRVAARAETIVLGAPDSLTTEMGPLISKSHASRLHEHVLAAQAAGARIVTGGTLRPDLGEAFYAPTVLDRVSPDMDIANTELFGPVLTVQRFSSVDEAVALANATSYGLAAGIWTESLTLAHTVARRLVAGTVWVNSYRVVSFAVPTSGRRDSGRGCENGVEALDEYLQPKSVWINLGGGTRDPFRIG